MWHGSLPHSAISCHHVYQPYHISNPCYTLLPFSLCRAQFFAPFLTKPLSVLAQLQGVVNNRAQLPGQPRIFTTSSSRLRESKGNVLKNKDRQSLREKEACSSPFQFTQMGDQSIFFRKSCRRLHGTVDGCGFYKFYKESQSKKIR